MWCFSLSWWNHLKHSGSQSSWIYCFFFFLDFHVTFKTCCCQIKECKNLPLCFCTGVYGSAFTFKSLTLMRSKSPTSLCLVIYPVDLGSICKRLFFLPLHCLNNFSKQKAVEARRDSQGPPTFCWSIGSQKILEKEEAYYLFVHPLVSPSGCGLVPNSGSHRWSWLNSMIHAQNYERTFTSKS